MVVDWLAAHPSDFVVCDACFKTPLVESVDSSTDEGHHTARAYTIEEYRKYMHHLQSDLGLIGSDNFEDSTRHATLI